jgi:hypothetical protein
MIGDHELNMVRKQTLQGIFHVACAISLILSLSFAARESILRAADLGQGNGNQEVGLPEGTTAPHFQAKDQFGKVQTDASVAAKNGTVLLFFRSADW